MFKSLVVITLLALTIATFSPASAADLCTGTEVLHLLPDAAGVPQFDVAVGWRTESPVWVEGKGKISEACGEAIPLPGVASGGLFWFFGHDNPEVFVKIVDACGPFHSHMVFISATTNVWFSITVREVATNKGVTWGNQMGHVATPVAAMEFPCN